MTTEKIAKTDGHFHHLRNPWTGKNIHKKLRNDGYMHVTDTKIKEESFLCQSVYNIKIHISFSKLIQYRNTTPIDEMYGHISHCVNS